MLLTGIYAINKRKDKIARQEEAQAVAGPWPRPRQRPRPSSNKAMTKAEAEKKAAIEREVKKALEEAAKAQGQEGE